MNYDKWKNVAGKPDKTRTSPDQQSPYFIPVRRFKKVLCKGRYDGALRTMLSDDGLLEIYIYPTVMGSYQVKACLAGSMSMEVDYCCGADANLAMITLVKLQIILSDRSKKYPFDGVPRSSKLRPYNRDSEFCEAFEKCFTDTIRRLNRLD